jgi:hypothetical protein
MAEWKKVIVSGSNISQLNNDAGYLTSATVQAANSFATMSIGGVSVIADVAADTLTIASASNSGLYITPNAGTDTVTFGLSAIPNSSLANDTVSIAAGNGLTDGGPVSLGGTTTLNIGAGTHITVNANDIAVNTTTLTPAVWAASASYTGSILSNISGDITIGTGGVAAIAAGVITNADINASAAIAASKINFAGTSFVSGSSIASGAQGEVTLTTNGVAASAIDLGLQTSDSPSFAGLTLSGDLAVNGGDITTSATTATVFNTTATTVNAFGAATTLNLGAGSGTTTVNNNLNIAGNLFVQGTTTQVNTTELLVEDKFIVLASGSATAGDGGIIIDRGSDAAGNIAFGFDSATDRWGYQNGLVDTTNAITIGTDGNSAFAGYVFTQAAHTSAPTTGEFVQAGAIYTANNGDIFIYS